MKLLHLILFYGFFCYSTIALGNYYEILSVSTESSMEEIEDAYKKKKLFYEINSEVNYNYGKDQLQNIKEAYETLHNVKKRMLYDTIQIITTKTNSIHFRIRSLDFLKTTTELEQKRINEIMGIAADKTTNSELRKAILSFLGSFQLDQKTIKEISRITQDIMENLDIRKAALQALENSGQNIKGILLSKRRQETLKTGSSNQNGNNIIFLEEWRKKK